MYHEKVNYYKPKKSMPLGFIFQYFSIQLYERLLLFENQRPMGLEPRIICIQQIPIHPLIQIEFISS